MPSTATNGREVCWACTGVASIGDAVGCSRHAGSPLSATQAMVVVTRRIQSSCRACPCGRTVGLAFTRIDTAPPSRFARGYIASDQRRNARAIITRYRPGVKSPAVHLYRIAAKYLQKTVFKHLTNRQTVLIIH